MLIQRISSLTVARIVLPQIVTFRYFNGAIAETTERLLFSLPHLGYECILAGLLQIVKAVLYSNVNRCEG